VTHWNNKEGGKDLDTSRCYMGRERFARLLTLLPSDTTILGVDEQVACIMDLAAGECQVLGPGGVTIIRDGQTIEYGNRARFGIEELGAERES
jgi:cyanophycinase-like exopeptidase